MTYEADLNLEERVASLFQPDTLLPAHYFETSRRRANLEPEKRLMLAVLEDAIACFQKYVLARDSREKGMFREAEEWILAENCELPFSFENVCEVLGFNPQYVRQGLMRWTERKLAVRPKAKIYRLTAGRAIKTLVTATSRKATRKLLKAAGFSSPQKGCISS